MATFVVAHGAWNAGWAWKKMRAPMRELGHELWTPTQTGLGERRHLAAPEVDLSTHVQDVLGVLECEDLNDVVLVGHSYGGMVATGVADRVPGRIRRLIYLDAFVPRDGESLYDLLGEAGRAHARQLREAAGETWRVPPNPLPPDTPADDVAWIASRRYAQPLRALEERIVLGGAVERLPRDYVYCTRFGPGDAFRPFAERARAEGWRCEELDASHNPHITMPATLAALLHRLALP